MKINLSLLLFVIVTTCLTSSTVCSRPPLRKTSNSLRLDRKVKFNVKDATPLAAPSIHENTEDNSLVIPVSPPKQQTVTFSEVETTVEFSSSPSAKSPRSIRGKAKIPRLVGEEKELTDETCKKMAVDSSLGPVSPSVSSPKTASPHQGRSKAKKAKHMPAVEPLQEEEEVTDTTGKKWKLMKLLSQNMTELIYEVVQIASRPNSNKPNHILKLGAKDGRLFNEQNFLQRAAKLTSVEKWIKQNKMDFLGIPHCAGFGVHADSYRFLIFQNMGQSLQSVMDKKSELLSEKTVLQLACRILDVLEYIHSNEYIHADINAENIYIKSGQPAQVYLGGYYLAFRYCPGGQHVEYRQASRTPHEGNLEFISVDSHKGAGPSRRSDLQSLGYCMLRWHTGTLPWSTLTQPEQIAKSKQKFMADVAGLVGHCFQNKKVSSAFQTFLVAVMALQYSEQPDYTALKAGLSAALVQLGGSMEHPLSI